MPKNGDLLVGKGRALARYPLFYPIKVLETRMFVNTKSPGFPGAMPVFPYD
jgi:hypothetical protein